MYIPVSKNDFLISSLLGLLLYGMNSNGDTLCPTLLLTGDGALLCDGGDKPFIFSAASLISCFILSKGLELSIVNTYAN